MNRLLVVDDQKIIREGVRCLLSGRPDLQVVADAETGKAAIEKAFDDGLNIDMVLMDIRMPEMDGIEVSRRILAEKPKTKIIMLSVFGDRYWVERSLKSGARGFVLKGCSKHELLSAINRVARGNIYLSPAIEGEIVADYIHRLRQRQPQPTPRRQSN